MSFIDELLEQDPEFAELLEEINDSEVDIFSGKFAKPSGQSLSESMAILSSGEKNK